MKKILVMLFAVMAVFSASAGDCYWIWGAEKIADGKSRSFFRLNVELEDDVVAAELYTIADDAMELYVNGSPAIKQVFFDQADKRIKIRKYEFKKELKKGKNNLAVIVLNNGGPGGIIMKGAIRLANGKTIDLNSNEQWKAIAAATVNANWKKVNFNDSSWKSAFKLGDASMKPWRNMSDAVNFFGLPGGSK